MIAGLVVIAPVVLGHTVLDITAVAARGNAAAAEAELEIIIRARHRRDGLERTGDIAAADLRPVAPIVLRPAAFIGVPIADGHPAQGHRTGTVVDDPQVRLDAVIARIGIGGPVFNHQALTQCLAGQQQAGQQPKLEKSVDKFVAIHVFIPPLQ